MKAPRAAVQVRKVLGALALVLAGCDQQPPETMAGPETPALAGQVRGIVVKAGRDAATQNTQGIFGISLADGREFIIKRGAGIGSVGGPDGGCRIVYTEGNLFSTTLATRMCLKRIRADGTGDETLFCRDGKPGKILGDDLALSDDGRWVAFISGLEAAQMPGAYLEEGSLELWDMERGHAVPTGVRVLHTEQSSLAWLPGGRRLAYVGLVPRSSLAAGLSEREAERFGSWSRVPVVHLLDRETRASRSLTRGWHPVVSPDGAAVLVDGLDGRVHAVETAGGRSRQVTWRGLKRAQQLALFDGGLVLFRGLPTAGAPIRRTKFGSFGAGVPMASLKVARLDTKEFATVVAHVDGRHRLSCGVCEAEGGRQP